MLKKLYQKEGKIIIANDKFINEMKFYYFMINNNLKNLNQAKIKYYETKGMKY
jgi:hypothetical protein